MADEQQAQWHEGLPEAIQQWDEVKNSDSPDKFWKQMEDMRSHIGTSIRIPGENASAEDHAAFNTKLQSKVSGLINTPNYDDDDAVGNFYNALGRPEAADKYTIPEMDTKGVAMDDSSIKEFMPIAHKHGLSQRQFDGIVADMTTGNVERAVKSHGEQQEQHQLLKNEWGLAYDNNIKKVANVATTTGAPQALVDAINAGQVDRGTAQWLLGIANGFKGGSQNLIEDKSSDQMMSPAAAKKEISEIMNNKKHAYWNSGDPGNQDAKDYMRKLYQMSTPKTNQASENQTVGVGGAVFQ